MRLHRRGIVVLCVAVLLLCAVSAQDAGRTLAEDVLLLPTRKIVYNDVEQIMHDADGARVYPISCGDTTYLPVRAVCNMLGIDIEWNGDTDTVDIRKNSADGAQEPKVEHAEAAELIYSAVDAINVQDWHRYVDLQVAENRQDYSNFLESPDNAKNHAGVFNILSAKVAEMKELSMDIASGLTDMDAYRQKYTQVAAYYVGMSYTVFQETKDAWNGVNYVLVIAVTDGDTWRIAEMSDAPIEILLDKGVGFGSADEWIALNRFYLRTAASETDAPVQTVQALRLSDRVILYDGVKQVMLNADGTRVFPISFSDTTYLPVRAICDMLGLHVAWSGETNTVFISAKTTTT